MTHTQGSVRWHIEDKSMACLSVQPHGDPIILTVGPCKSCCDRSSEWQWGRCMTPTEADARRLAASWNALSGISTEAIEAGAVAELIEAAWKGLNYITNTESEWRIQLESGDALRNALAKFPPPIWETHHDR